MIKEIEQLTPSYVVFNENERLFGCYFNDLVVQSDMKHWSFTVVEESNGKPII